jgi:hypothetical protein
MTKYFVQNVGEVELEQRHFKAAGGEKNIYVKGNTAFAIYHNPTDMIPMAKIQELSVLQHPHIIRPQNLILDKKNKPVGFTQQFVKDAVSLVKLFPKAFRNDNHISHEMMLDLVKKLQEMVLYVHSSGILIVDLNELNFLTNNTFDNLWAIDVNSWQTPHFPATVIMPHIRDRHAKKFDQGTDWFSFGIVSFQMLIGLHPYRGGHPDFASLAADERLDARMKANVSALNSKSTLPAAAQPLDVIPPALKQWYLNIFEKGERIAPPTDYEHFAKFVAKVKEIVGSNLFIMKEIETFPDIIVNVCSSGGIRVVQTESQLFINKHKFSTRKGLQVGFTPKFNKPVGMYLENDLVIVVDLSTDNELYRCSGDGVMSYDGRLYVKNGLNVIEVVFLETTNKTIAAPKVVGTTLDLPEATKVLDGVIVQNLLGRHVVSVFPESGVCRQINIPELDGYRLIDAKFDKILMVVAEKKGQYDRFVFCFDKTYANHVVRIVKDTDYSGLNFTVAEHGVCVMINEEEKVEAFTASSNVKLMDDPAIDGDMRLFHDGTQILLAKGNKLFSMTMK